MKKLLEQIIKFGFVGIICFLIDFAISTALFYLLFNAWGVMSRGAATAMGGFWGFTISVALNYILSMKFVFERKENMSRKKEFAVFVILSIIGLGVNELILLGCNAVYENSAFLLATFHDTLWFAASKIIATAIVMVYNFISRKIFLEKKA
ncbi:MAG: GtrA family protein [Lachnospiraceae bacterium]|nr:GtrA family protein [Lachnospiraceae bacterium]